MKKTTPTYAAYTTEDMNALFGTRPATSTAQEVTCPDGYTAYTIKAGDTLLSIAKERGITVTELLFYNPNLNPYGYKKGDIVCVPQKPAGEGTGTETLPTPSLPGENKPAEEGPGPETLPTPSVPGENQPAEEGTGPVPLPTPTVPAPTLPSTPACPNGTLYTVKAGDTLRVIARRFGITLDALMSANPGISANRLIIGQKLCIPTAICEACCPAGTTAVRINSTNFVDYLVTYNISYAALSAANPDVDLENLTMGRQLCIPPAGSRGNCGEGIGTQELPLDITPTELAEDLKVTVAQLMRTNPTYTPTDFKKGRIICVPPAMQ